jgi:hypothetical protein
LYVSIYQSHFNDLCALIGHPTPVEMDPHGRFFSPVGVILQPQPIMDLVKKAFFGGRIPALAYNIIGLSRAKCTVKLRSKTTYSTGGEGLDTANAVKDRPGAYSTSGNGLLDRQKGRGLDTAKGAYSTSGKGLLDRRGGSRYGKGRLLDQRKRAARPAGPKFAADCSHAQVGR